MHIRSLFLRVSFQKPLTIVLEDRLSLAARKGAHQTFWLTRLVYLYIALSSGLGWGWESDIGSFSFSCNRKGLLSLVVTQVLFT